MLRKEAVSPQLLENLAVLMDMPSLRTHRLVGGTALALQIGHRLSLDIDLFSNEKNNYEQIQEELFEKFGNKFAKARNLSGSMGKGIAVFLHDIKTDILDWKATFLTNAILVDGVRMASKEDIIPMKFNTFLCNPELARYEKKDFVDIANLMKEYSLQQMISLYQRKYPNEPLSSRQMIEGLLLSEMADKKVMPQMLTGETWDDTKKQLEKSIEQFVKTNA